MRFVKLAIFSLASIFILFTAIGLLMPSSVTVLRTQTINASKESVFSYLSDLNKWHDWLNNDAENSQTTSSLKNAPITYGSYKITLIGNDSNRIRTLWQNNRSTQLKSIMDVNDDNKTTSSCIVMWRFQQQLKWYPWERLTGMLHDKILGPSMEASLLKLKQVIEKN